MALILSSPYVWAVISVDGVNRSCGVRWARGVNILWTLAKSHLDKLWPNAFISCFRTQMSPHWSITKASCRNLFEVKNRQALSDHENQIKNCDFYKKEEDGYSRRYELDECSSQSANEKLFWSLYIIFTAILPLVVIIYSYTVIICFIRKGVHKDGNTFDLAKVYALRLLIYWS